MTFNADKFMAGVQGGNATVTLVCPEGEYKAFVDDGDKAIGFRTFEGKDGKPPSHQCTVLMAITGDQEPNKFLKRDKVLVPYTMWLDLDDAGENLSMEEGKNVKLGKLRELFGQNAGAWNPNMMKGKGPFMIKVTQRPDRDDPSVKYAEVSRVAPIT